MSLHTHVETQMRDVSMYKLWGLCIVIFGIQLGVLFLFGTRHSIGTFEGRNYLTNRLRGTILTADIAPDFLDLLDPMLFGWPKRHGFSAGIWGIEPTSLPESPVPEPEPMFLECYPYDLSRIADNLAKLAPMPEFQLLNKRDVEPVVDVHLIGSPIPQVTWIEVRGELGTRPITHIPPGVGTQASVTLPAPPTVLDVAVGSSGVPMTVLVESSSGVPALDKLALEIVAGMRWEPNLKVVDEEPNRALQWGKIVFNWGTRLQYIPQLLHDQ